MKLLILLSRGHGQKEPGHFDPGVVEGELREVDLAGAYLDVAEALLRAEHVVYRLDDGPYHQRHQQAAALAQRHPDLQGIFAQGHVNAGGGGYGAVRPDARSKRGAQVARILASALDELEEVVGVRTDELYPSIHAARAAGRHPHLRRDGTEDWGWWVRGHACIGGIYPIPRVTSVLFEPGFLDTRTHAPLWTPAGLVRVGERLAEGLMRCVPAAESRMGRSTGMLATH